MSDELARIALDGGKGTPYDAPDAWDDDNDRPPPPPAKDWAHAAARGIISDLLDRRDIKFAFHGIDEDIRIEIVEAMAAIIRLAYRDSLTHWHDVNEFYLGGEDHV